jgi:hypothetical protein
MAASMAVQGGSDEQQTYADDRTRAGEYWQAQDRMFEGNVEVGPLEPVREPTPPRSKGMSS